MKNPNRSLSSVIFLFSAVGFGLDLTVFTELNILNSSEIVNNQDRSLAFLSSALMTGMKSRC